MRAKLIRMIKKSANLLNQYFVSKVSIICEQDIITSLETGTMNPGNQLVFYSLAAVAA